jgi:hypothetical protein
MIKYSIRNYIQQKVRTKFWFGSLVRPRNRGDWPKMTYFKYKSV